MIPEPSFLDLGFQAAETPEGPMDFGLLARLRRSATVLDLRNGARRAFEIFPKSSARWDRGHWKSDSGSWDIEELNLQNFQEVGACVQSRMANRMDLSRGRGIQQLHLKTPNHQYLFTRLHHALGDGVSLLLWLQEQFGVGQRSLSVLKLKRHSAPQRKSDYSGWGPSTRLRWAPTTRPGKGRRFMTWRLDLSQLAGTSEWSLNDCLVAGFLRSGRRFRVSRRRPLSVWIPMNIREHPFEGFGNGASRIRVYDRGGDTESFRETALQVRRQVKHCRETGEWDIPAKVDGLAHWPEALSRRLIKAYAFRPWVDMGSLFFSSIGRLPPPWDHESPFDQMCLVAPAHPHHPVSLVSVGVSPGQMDLTATWNAGLVERDSVIRFVVEGLKESQIPHCEIEFRSDQP